MPKSDRVFVDPNGVKYSDYYWLIGGGRKGADAVPIQSIRGCVGVFRSTTYSNYVAVAVEPLGDEYNYEIGVEVFATAEEAAAEQIRLLEVWCEETEEEIRETRDTIEILKTKAEAREKLRQRDRQ